MTTNDPTTTGKKTIYDELAEKADLLIAIGKACESATDTISRIYQPTFDWFDTIYNLPYPTPGHSGQGTVYNLLSIHYEKERMTQPPPMDTVTRKAKPTFTRKTTRSTIPPVKKKAWKGRR